jgi:hypothetical protein
LALRKELDVIFRRLLLTLFAAGFGPGAALAYEPIVPPPACVLRPEGATQTNGYEGLGKGEITLVFDLTTPLRATGEALLAAARARGAAPAGAALAQPSPGQWRLHYACPPFAAEVLLAPGPRGGEMTVILRPAAP